MESMEYAVVIDIVTYGSLVRRTWSGGYFRHFHIHFASTLVSIM